MPRTPQDVTDAELAVLERLWDHGPATRRRLADALYPGGAARYTTVQKLLERLEAKGYVDHGPEAEGVTFRAVAGREQLIRSRLQDLAVKLCGGSVTPLLMNLVRTQPLTPNELDELQALVADLKKQAKSKGK